MLPVFCLQKQPEGHFPELKEVQKEMSHQKINIQSTGCINRHEINCSVVIHFQNQFPDYLALSLQLKAIRNSEELCSGI